MNWAKNKNVISKEKISKKIVQTLREDKNCFREVRRHGNMPPLWIYTPVVTKIWDEG
ncbi:hypothetical protein [uncultured Methanomethylovorans sp.]|uniref:hypothetical protein n=1 Tax=uncultured Methanomethylovorans sp. TaxID=183759 RepID=UPI002AA623E5|nr:hypothetical protein [uncultured Methanomethylovorans sp.]